MRESRILKLLVLLALQLSSAVAQVNVYCNVQNNNGASVTNQGLSYGYYDTNPYPNTVGGTSPPAQRYPTYDPTYVNTLAPIYTGQTTYIGFPFVQGTTQLYPDSPLHTVVNVTLVHRGFLYARTSGTYTITSTRADDIVLTWTGDTAYSGYTRANAVQELAAANTQTAVSYGISLTAGQYLPLRVQVSNAQEAIALTYSITDPTGNVLLDRTRSTDVVTQPCDNSARFPPLYGGNPSCAGDSTLSTDGVGNSGLQYGIWNSSTRNTDSSFSTYPVAAFDGTAAVHLGVTNRVYINVPVSANGGGSVVQIYRDTNQRFNSAFITIIHRGYLYARTSGTYTFSVTSADDIALVWVGNNAVSGFTRANANAIYVTSNNPQTQTFTTFLNAGQYLPVRIQWDNGQGGAGLSLVITNGEGRQLMNSTAVSDFYYPSCPGQTSNGNAIPQFGPWFSNSTSYTTITSVAADSSATGTVTSTLTDPSGTTPGTVEVIIPRTYVTVTSANTFTDGSQSGTVTTVVNDPSGTAPGTVVIYTPVSSSVTSVSPTMTSITRPATITTAFASNTCTCTPVSFSSF